MYDLGKKSFSPMVLFNLKNEKNSAHIKIKYAHASYIA